MSRLAVIALGSNVGDSRHVLLEAMEALRTRALDDWRRSSFYDTSPVDCPQSSPRFMNAVVSFLPSIDETPEQLLDWMLDLEKRHGRLPKILPNEPRKLDLDLILFGGHVQATEKLTLPHPRAHLRRFVLEPLTEILPNLVFPGFQITVSEMLQNLHSQETVVQLSEL